MWRGGREGGGEGRLFEDRSLREEGGKKRKAGREGRRAEEEGFTSA